MTVPMDCAGKFEKDKQLAKKQVDSRKIYGYECVNGLPKHNFFLQRSTNKIGEQALEIDRDLSNSAHRYESSSAYSRSLHSVTSRLPFRIVNDAY